MDSLTKLKDNHHASRHYTIIMKKNTTRSKSVILRYFELNIAFPHIMAKMCGKYGIFK